MVFLILEKCEIQDNMKLVVDSSIWARLVDSSESKVKLVNKLFEMIVGGKVNVLAPDLLQLELANLVVVGKKLPKITLVKTINNLIGAGLSFKRMEVDEISELADLIVRYKLTSYDACYLLLAKKYKCKMLTADKQLLKVKKYCISLADFERLIK